MTELDQVLARRALERNRLSSGQVEQLLEEAGRTGRSFRELAIGRGLLTTQDLQALPPKQVPLPVMILIGVALTIVALFIVVTTMNRAAARQGPERPASLQGSK
jgi:hypothetical protein